MSIETDEQKTSRLAPENCGCSIPKWVWNLPLEDMDEEEIRRQFSGFKEQDRYDGVMIVLWGYPGYMSKQYLAMYRRAVEIAAEVGIKVIIWDENGFPSGSAGGLIAERYPQYVAKQLDMTVYESDGGNVTITLPEGLPMAVVAMDGQYNRRDLCDHIANGVLTCILPAGKWKIMLFMLNDARQSDGSFSKNTRMDYLDGNAVRAFLKVTHEQYYKVAGEYFGSTVLYSFFDEPALYWVGNGRIWTSKFNEKFIKANGYSPAVLYPALFMDIGADTPSARCALLDFRARLFADEYVGTMAKWCHAHGIRQTGHFDQEEISNPTPLSGDLIRALKHTDMPGCDEIAKYGRGSRGYKLASSAAVNYGKQLVMCEVFGAMNEGMPLPWLYKEAVDLLAKGVNFFVPHGTWYDNVNNVTFPPELSYRSVKFGMEMGRFNTYLRKCCSLLQNGATVADIALFYPIADLQAGYFFDESEQYKGGRTPVHTNYLELGEMLSLQIRKDFIYLHPEVLEENCAVGSGMLQLDNGVYKSEFPVCLLPAMAVIPVAAMRRFKAFYDAGGILIFAGQTPSRSAEQGFDGEVQRIMAAIFDSGNKRTALDYICVNNDAGGRAYQIPKANKETLSQVLSDTNFLFDVDILAADAPVNGNLTYIHKKYGTRNIYFIANSGDNTAQVEITVRGRGRFQLWEPGGGASQRVPALYAKKGEMDRTRFGLVLAPVSSLFLVEEE